jgi:hypothetical protein
MTGSEMNKNRISIKRRMILLKMKNKLHTYYLLLALVLLTFTISCGNKEVSSEFNSYINNPLNDTVWATSLKPTDAVNTMTAELVNALETVKIDLAADEVTCRPGGNDSLRIIFKKGIFTTFENGVITPVNPEGTADVEVLRIRRSADLIRCIRPCIIGNDLTILGGGLFIRVTKNGKELSIRNGSTYRIILTETGANAPNADMSRMFGSESTPPPLYNVTDPRFSWQPDNDNSKVPFFTETIGGVTRQSYHFIINRLRWIAAARIVSPNSNPTKSRVSVYFPPNFTNKTTNVFAVVTGQKTVARFDFNYNTRTFLTDLMPNGTNFRVVSISKIGNDFYMDQKSISNLSTPTILKLEPKKIRKEKLQEFLDDL